MSSNVTLFIILAMWLWFGYDGRRRQILETAPALALYGLWFVTYGMRGLGADGHLSAYRTLVRMVPYTLTGLASGTGGALGLPVIVGAFVLGVLAVRYRPPAPLVAFLIAIVAMFIVASLFRSMSGTDQAAGSRYVTLSVYLATFGLAAAGPKITIGRARALAVGVFAAACNLVTFGLAVRHFP